MGYGDPVGGAQQTDHYLGPVRAMIPRIPEHPGRERVGLLGGTLEIGGRQVVAHQPKIQVGQIT